MKWAFARSFLRTESFFGIIAVVIAVSNAPVFQNIGIQPNGSERLFVVAYYVSLVLALLALFLGRILFELYCPEPVKSAATLDQYLVGIPDETDDDAEIRGQMTAEWRTANQQQRGKNATTFTLFIFLFLFPASFCLAALALLEFALRPDQNPPEHLSIDIRFERAQDCAVKSSEIPQRQRPKCPSADLP